LEVTVGSTVQAVKAQKRKIGRNKAAKSFIFLYRCQATQKILVTIGYRELP